MKYIDGTFYKSCHERLREKVLLNTDTGKEYVAYYPEGYEVLGYFNSGSQVNVSLVRARHSHKNIYRTGGVENNIFLLKNEDPQARGLSGALKREMQVSHLVAKSFKPQYAPKIPQVIEGAYICNNPIRSYLIEELVPGEPLTLQLFNSLSKTRQKWVLTELAASLCKMHFYIPDRYLKLSEFCIDTGGLFPDPVPGYNRQKEIDPFFLNQKLPLIHDDLSPANIIYDREKITIIDYGRAGISSRKEDFKSARQNYSDKFAMRLMDRYLLVCGLAMKKWHKSV